LTKKEKKTKIKKRVSYPATLGKLVNSSAELRYARDRNVPASLIASV
jgi:hypothetical protein